MVGDTVFDAEGAKQAGFNSICVLYGFGEKEELVSAGAGKIAQSVAELKRLHLEE